MTLGDKSPPSSAPFMPTNSSKAEWTMFPSNYLALSELYHQAAFILVSRSSLLWTMELEFDHTTRQWRLRHHTAM